MREWLRIATRVKLAVLATGVARASQRWAFQDVRTITLVEAMRMHAVLLSFACLQC